MGRSSLGGEALSGWGGVGEEWECNLPDEPSTL